MSNAKIGVALVGGYLLGRTKKAKLAVGMGMFLAGKKLDFDPRQIGKLVANNPVLSGLNDQVRSELVEATKKAATGALTKRATSFADSLHERTLDLNDPSGRQSRKGKDDEDGDEARDDERDTRSEASGEDESDEKPAPRRKAASTKASAGSKARSTTGGGASKSASAAGKTASGASKKTSGTAKSAAKGSSTARKTASGTRKAATGTVTKSTERGGRNG
ncbi:hypothetical protein [Streptomyces tsukubensis]|nr:hypothetical protein [Streptomyces tsukubensis]